MSFRPSSSRHATPPEDTSSLSSKCLMNVYDWIFSIFLEASGSSQCDQVSLHFDYDFPQRFVAEPPFPLLDPSLEGRRRVMLFGSSQTMTSVCCDMVQILLLQLEQQSLQDIELEFLLWCGVSSCNFETLKLCLKITREKDNKPAFPASLMTSLLCRALTLFFVDGVKLLLSFGADPNLGVDPCHKAPLMQISELHNVLFLRHTFVDKSLTDMTLLLLKHGANPLARGDSGAIPLHDVGRLSLNAADCAALLIKSTSPSGYFCLTKETNQLPAVSPLTAAFYTASWTQSNHRAARLARIFSFSIIPLIRCGASLIPDPFEFLEVPSCFLFLPELHAAGLESHSLWMRPNMFTMVALEARQKASLDVVRLRKIEATLIEGILSTGDGRTEGGVGNYLSSQSALSRDKVQVVQNMTAFIRSQFPRSLQGLCRLAILRSLPSGPDRPGAIESLGLPACLEHFLSFRELDVHIEALVAELDQN